MECMYWGNGGNGRGQWHRGNTSVQAKAELSNFKIEKHIGGYDADDYESGALTR
jgi:hypothetical protein